METIENTIIQNLVTNEEYTRKVLPFLKPDYFDKTHEKIIFDECAKFIVAYDKCPTKEILSIECEKRKDINDDTYKEIVTYLNDIELTPTSEDWLKILQRSGVKKEQSILHWSRVSLLQMDMISRKVLMLSLLSYQTHSLSDLITMLDTIT